MITVNLIVGIHMTYNLQELELKFNLTAKFFFGVLSYEKLHFISMN